MRFNECSRHYCYKLSLHPLPSVSLSPVLFLNLGPPMGHITKRQDLCWNCVESHHTWGAPVLGTPLPVPAGAVCLGAIGKCGVCMGWGGDRKDIGPRRQGPSTWRFSSFKNTTFVIGRAISQRAIPSSLPYPLKTQQESAD